MPRRNLKKTFDLRDIVKSNRPYVNYTPIEERIVGQCWRMLDADTVNLSDFPKVFDELMEDRIWERCDSTLAEFVTAEFPRGLGSNAAQIERFLADAPNVLTRFRREMTRARGGDRRSEAFRNNNVIYEKPVQGNSRSYTVARLEREAPELYERVCNGELSAHAAAIKAGFRKPPATPLEKVMRELHRLDGEELDQVREEIERILNEGE